MKTHMLFRMKVDGKWTTLEGAIHDSWATYDNVDDCLTWQNRLADRKLLNHDIAQVICVEDSKLAAFREGSAKGEEVQQLVATGPGGPLGLDDIPAGIWIGLGLGVLVIAASHIYRWMSRRWI